MNVIVRRDTTQNKAICAIRTIWPDTHCAKNYATEWKDKRFARFVRRSICPRAWWRQWWGRWWWWWRGIRGRWGWWWGRRWDRRWGRRWGQRDVSGAPETFTAHFAVTFARYGFVITCSNLFGMRQPQRKRGRRRERKRVGHPVWLYDIWQQFMTVWLPVDQASESCCSCLWSKHLGSNVLSPSPCHLFPPCSI